MALAGKIEAEVEIKSDGDEILHFLVGKKSHHAPNLVPHHIQQLDLHEGEWGDHGSIKVWTYVIEGKVETFKEEITINEENKSVQLKGLEGHVLEIYKSYNLTFQIIPKGETTKVVKITLEYEMKNKQVPPPQNYMDFLIKLVTDVDAKLLQG